jgi:hypothetical protein
MPNKKNYRQSKPISRKCANCGKLGHKVKIVALIRKTNLKDHMDGRRGIKK